MDKRNSLFLYDQGLDFAYYSGCSEPYGGDVDLANASAEIRHLCGIDEECLIDGVELGREVAQSTLENKAEVLRASTAAKFRVSPSVWVEDAFYNVTLTVNLSSVESGDTSDIEAYSIYRLMNQGSRFLGTADAVTRKKNVFSLVVPLQSTIAGESVSFHAVPVVDGADSPVSPHVFTRLNSAICFSRASMIGMVDAIVDLQGFPKSIRVRSYTLPEQQPVSSISRLGGAVESISVPVHATLMELREGPANVSTQIDCLAGSCRLEGFDATLSLDLTGLPSDDNIQSFLHTNEGSSFRSLRSGVGGNISSHEILALDNFTVVIIETNGYYAGSYGYAEVRKDVTGVDCSSGACRVGGVSSSLELDLTNLPKSVSVALINNESDGTLRYIYKQGGAVRAYGVLNAGVLYDVEYRDGAARLSVSGIDCGSGFCSVGPVSAVLEIDLTGLPSDDNIQAFLHTNEGSSFRSLRSGVGGNISRHEILALDNFTVVIIETNGYYAGSYGYAEVRKDVTGVDCSSGACRVGDVSSSLELDLTNLPKSVSVALINNESDGTLRYIYKQGGGVRTYGVLNAGVLYDVEYRDGAARLSVSGIDCGSGFCSVGPVSAVLEIDLAGLPSDDNIGAFLHTNEGSSFRSLRSGVGGNISSHEILALDNFTVVIIETNGYYAGSYGYAEVRKDVTGMDCSSGACRVGDVSSSLELDLTILPESVDVQLLDSQSGGRIRTIYNQGGAVREYGVLCDILYTVVVTNAGTESRQSFTSCRCGGKCSPGL